MVLSSNYTQDLLTMDLKSQAEEEGEEQVEATILQEATTATLEALKVADNSSSNINSLTTITISERIGEGDVGDLSSLYQLIRDIASRLYLFSQQSKLLL